MAIQSLPRRIVVIGRDERRPTCAGVFGMSSEGDSLVSTIGAGPGNDRYPALADFDGEPDDAVMLVMCQRRCFSRRTARHDAVRAVRDLPFNEIAERPLIELAVAERRHNCDY